MNTQPYLADNLMNRTLSTLALLACLSICLPELATADVLQQATIGTPKSTTAPAAAQADRPGKRFWGRIMGAFRDIHSVEKQRKEY